MLRKVCGVCAVAALMAMVAARADAQGSYPVDTSQSYLDVDVQIGAFATGDPEDPDTWVNVPPGTPGAFWFAAAYANGQGDVPSLPIGDPVIPGYSTGLSAQIGGTLNVDLGSNSLPGGSSMTLLNSGSWQPNPGGPEPLPGNLGVYFDPTNPANSEFPAAILAVVSNGALDVVSTNFLNDPLATVADHG